MKLTMLAYTIIIRRIYVRMIGTERGDQRTDRWKPKPQKTSQSDHRTTALSNSVTLTMQCEATQDRQVMVERSDRMWSTGEGEWKTASLFLP